jgi:chemotaxis protein CheD
MNQTSAPQGSARIYIAQGEHAIASGPDAVISTLLGSCVAVCLWDPVARIGGMNHFLLPDEGVSSPGMSGYGANAMELVINGLIRGKAQRSRLRAKLFGGAVMISGLSNVGMKNAKFALAYLERENIPCDSQSLGGTQARRVEFWPADGRVRIKFLSDVPIVAPPPKPVVTADVELF